MASVGLLQRCSRPEGALTIRLFWVCKLTIAVAALAALLIVLIQAKRFETKERWFLASATTCLLIGGFLPLPRASRLVFQRIHSPYQPALKNKISFIRKVLIYGGRGPYFDDIPKKKQLFEALNVMRTAHGLPEWRVEILEKEQIASALAESLAEETLVVIPPGPSSLLDEALGSHTGQLHAFGMRGGRFYFECGSAYWAATSREYLGLSEEKVWGKKMGLFPLFRGRAKGPLCPYPAYKYNIGFKSEAVRVQMGERECTVFHSGGGCFILDPEEKATVIARYLPSELIRLGKTSEECALWEKAAILTPVGKGAALLAMFHADGDVLAEAEAFPDCGTDWESVRKNLSPLAERRDFLYAMLSKLEQGVSDA